MSQVGYAGFLALISVLATILILYFFCPHFASWRELKLVDDPDFPLSPTTQRAADTLDQLKHPFAPTPQRYPDCNRVITWRILFPVIWHYLSLPVWLLLLMPYLGCLLTLGSATHIVYQRTRSRRWAFYAAALTGASPWFFVSTGWLAYFDSWLMMGLLTLAFARSRVALTIACLCVPWIDERLLTAVPLCITIRAVEIAIQDRDRAKGLIRDSLAILVPCMVYPFLRLLLASGGIGGVETAEYVHYHLSWTRLTSVSLLRYVDGLWSALRAGWFFVVALLWLLWVAGRRLLCCVLTACLVCSIMVWLVIAIDLSRSLGMLALVSLTGILYMARQKPGLLRTALPVVATANLLLPATHVLTIYRIPILYVYSEVFNWQHPSPYLDPNSYTEQGVECLRRGQSAEGRSNLDRALKLDGESGPAYLARSTARLQTGDIRGAMADAEQAIRYGPQDVEAYYIRALARLASRNPVGAASDLRHALQLAPPDWPRHREVQEMLARVGQSSPKAPPNPR
ncbi:MAG: hypothetical protein AB1714_17610 [Acidobacteriota bacterium]